MLRVRVATGFLVALALAVTGAWFALTQGQRAQVQLERAAAANAVLDELLSLSASADRLLRLLSETAISGEFDQAAVDALGGRLDRGFDALRRDIASEVALLERPAEADAEEQELSAVGALERDVGEAMRLLRDVGERRAPARVVWFKVMDRLDGREPDGFRQRLEAAIAEERRESVAADASAERAMGTIRAAAQVYAIGSIALLLSLVWFFVRRIREPFEELMAGTEAMRAGDRTRRIRVRSSDEFGLIGTSVNAMADEVDRHRRELEAAHGRLEATVAQRTEQLRVANDGLLKADARRRQLFADISHELRTPLTAIRGEAEIALRGGPKPADDYRVALQQITDVSGQLGRLVDDLLFISRNDAGVHALRMEPVPMGALLQSVCQQGRAIGHARSIDVVHEPLREDAIVLGDRDRLRQLFMILIDNAIRYTPGTTPVVVSAAQDAGRLVVRVADQGVGIPEDALSEVFRRFYRGDRSATQGGTGLGLPIAKAIAESHGGTIEIRSTPNVGTTVVVSLAHAGPAAEAA